MRALAALAQTGVLMLPGVITPQDNSGARCFYEEYRPLTFAGCGRERLNPACNNLVSGEGGASAGDGKKIAVVCMVGTALMEFRFMVTSSLRQSSMPKHPAQMPL